MEPLSLDKIRRSLAAGIERSGKTQLAASSEAGLAVSKVNRFLSGKRGKRGEDVIHMINKLAAVANLDLGGLLGVDTLRRVDHWPAIPVFPIRSVPPMQSKGVANFGGTPVNGYGSPSRIHRPSRYAYKPPPSTLGPAKRSYFHRRPRWSRVNPSSSSSDRGLS